MKNVERIEKGPPGPPLANDNGSRGQGYAKLIARRCAHLESKSELIYSSIESGKILQNGKSQFISTLVPKKTSQSAPTSPSKTYRPCCAPLHTPSSSQNFEKDFTTSEPSSPRRRLLRQSALENSKESLVDHHEKIEKLPNRNFNNNIVTKIPNRATPASTPSKKQNMQITSEASAKASISQHQHKCNGIKQNGDANPHANANSGHIFRDRKSHSGVNHVNEGQRPQRPTRREQNGQWDHNNVKMKPTFDNDVKNAKDKLDTCTARQLAISKPSCISSSNPQPTPPPRIQNKSTRKRLPEQAIRNRPISTTSKTTTSQSPTNSSLGEPQQQQGRKLISQETTGLFVNGQGTTKGTTKEEREHKSIKSNKNLNLKLRSISSGDHNPPNCSLKSALSSNSLMQSNNDLGKSGDSERKKLTNGSDVEMGKRISSNGLEGQSMNNGSQDLVEFIQPLEPNLEFLEGSDIQLKVKIKGAKKVIWVKNDQIIPNIPPDFEYKSNPRDGTFSLKVKDAFLEDSGLYICEAYGSLEESDTVCWCHVEVLEEIFEDDTSVELEEGPEDQKTRRLIVPIIITSDASADEISNSKAMEPVSPTSVKRSNFKELRDISAHSSKDVFEDAVEDLEEKSNGVGGNDHSLSNSKLSSPLSNGMDNSFLSESELYTTALQSESQLNSSGSIWDDAESGSSGQNEPLKTQVDNGLDETFDVAKFDSSVHFGGTEDQPILEEMEISPANSNRSESVFGKTTYSADMSLSTSYKGMDSSISDMDHEIERNFSDESILSSPCQSISVKTPESTGSPVDLSMSYDSSCPSGVKNGDPRRPLRPQSSTESMSSTGSEVFNASSLDDRSILEQSPNSAHLRQLQPRDSLTDQLPPRILIAPSNLIAIIGETVNIRIKIQSTDEMNTEIGWCKFVRGIYRRLGNKPASEEPDNHSSSHILIRKINRDLISLTISNCNYEDSGKYRVKVKNNFGIDYHQCIVYVEGPPEPPSTPPKALFDQASNAFLISWHSCVYDGGSAVTGYCLETSVSPVGNNSQDDKWTVLTPPSFKWLCFTLESPKPGHRYRFRVSVENAYGKGKFSASSDGIVINSPSESPNVDTEGNNNPDRTVSLIYDYNQTFEWTEPTHDYKDVSLKNQQFSNYYDKFEQLGKGRFGVVFKVVNKDTGKSYAGKFVKCIKAKDKERAQLEYKIMNELKFHPKLICLADAFEMHREIVIVTEMINGGELFERVVADDFTLTEHDCIAFLRQICDGVNYIHQNKIMHLDLKPENILCTTKTSNQIKIIDFGLAQHYDPDKPISVLFGTAEFVSPEIINYDTICPATDMWSIGVITYILLSGLSPFLGDNDNETFSNITKGEFDFDDEAFDNISEEAKEFISNLIIKRKEKRLTAKECLEHRWLALSDAEKKDIVLPTIKLKRFLVRRKWQKSGNAIRALGRITTLYSSRKSSSSSTSSQPNANSPVGSLQHRQLSSQDSVEYDSVFGSIEEAPISPEANSDPANVSNFCNSGNTTVVSSPVSKTAPLQEEADNPSEPGGRNVGKYTETSRSDSGVCDVASTPVTPTPQE